MDWHGEDNHWKGVDLDETLAEIQTGKKNQLYVGFQRSQSSSKTIGVIQVEN